MKLGKFKNTILFSSQSESYSCFEEDNENTCIKCDLDKLRELDGTKCICTDSLKYFSNY